MSFFESQAMRQHVTHFRSDLTPLMPVRARTGCPAAHKSRTRRSSRWTPRWWRHARVSCGLAVRSLDFHTQTRAWQARSFAGCRGEDLLSGKRGRVVPEVLVCGPAWGGGTLWVGPSWVSGPGGRERGWGRRAPSMQLSGSAFLSPSVPSRFPVSVSADVGGSPRTQASAGSVW